VLSVLLGSTSESARAQESQKLLNWAFQAFDAARLYGAGETVREIDVWKGAAPKVKAGLRSELVVAVPKGQGEKLKAELVAASPLVAPIAEGQRVGLVRVSVEGRVVSEAPVVALSAVPAAGIFGRAWDTLRLWFQ
jgi:D-alanyl-D-alanine carboxypeptidase (penicillin-binding protein 5/6)